MEVEILKSVDAINSVNKVNYELADKQHQIEIMKKNMEIQRKELEKARLFKLAAAVFVAIIIFLGFTIKYLRTALSEKRNLLAKLSYHLRNGKTKEKTGSSTAWRPETDCINNPISYSP